MRNSIRTSTCRVGYRRYALSLLMLTLFVTGCGSLLNKQGSSDAKFLQTKDKIDAIVSQIKDNHSIRVYYDQSPWFSWLIFRYKLASKSDYAKLLQYLKVLQKELDKYPKNFLYESGFESIIVCRNLSSWGVKASGYPDFGGKAVYYNYNNKCIGNKTIHHEICHILDNKFNGDVYKKDPNWLKLNRKDFEYGKGGRNFHRNIPISNKWLHPSPGFYSVYAKSAQEEDKAEIYSALFVENYSACLHEWIKEDKVLRDKVDYMKDFLLHHSDEMTSDFWANLCADECSLDVMGQGLYEIEDPRFSAVLSEDASFELIAITEISGKSNKWWKPNGEVFDKAPFKNDIPETTDDELKQYQLFFCNRIDQSLFANFKELSDGQIYQSKHPFFSKDGRLFQNVIVLTCGWDKDQEAAQITAEIPFGKWMTIAIYNPKTKITSGIDKNVIFSKIYKEKGSLIIDVSNSTLDSQKTAVKIEVLDQSGEILRPVKWSHISQESSLTFRNLKASQIKEVQYQVCPYAWVTFENISLRPEQTTDVQVKVDFNENNYNEIR